jgi:glutaredoxin
MLPGEQSPARGAVPAMTIPICSTWSGFSGTIKAAARNLKMKLIVYTAPWCRDCREAKRFLAKHNIDYDEVDIETTPGAAEEVIRRTGKRAIPQFVLDGVWVQPYRPGKGFLYEEMSELLGVAEPLVKK